jgi:DNA-directed RNA polymerase subunit RPC12/RpoP
LKENHTIRIHPPSGTIASYVAGTCSQDVDIEVEEHCIECEECRMMLTILFRVRDESANEQKMLEDECGSIHKAVMRFLRLFRALETEPDEAHAEKSSDEH